MPTGLFTSFVVAVELSAGVWTDITSSVTPDSIAIHVGRESPTSGAQPGTLDLALDNADGQWTPDNATSSRYPNWTEGKRIRVQVVVSGVTTTVFVGRVASIVPDFPDEPLQSKVAVRAEDSLGDLSRITLRDLPRQKALAQSLTMFPLDDPDGSTSAATVNGDRAPLPVPGGLFADASTLGYDRLSFLTLPANQTLNLPGAGWTTTSFFVRTTNTATPVFYLEPGDGTVTYVDVQWTGTAFTMRVYGLAGLYDQTLTISTTPGWHYLSVYIEVDAGGSPATSFSLTVDGTTSADSNGAFPPTTSTPRLARIAPTSDLGLAYLTANATLADVWRSVLIGGESTETFIGTLTTIGRLSTASVTLDGTASLGTTLSPVSADGATVLDIVAAIADVEGGYVWHEYSTSATQTVRILDRASSSPTAVALTVDVELDLDGGPTMVRERTGRPAAVTAKSPSQAATSSTTSVAGGQTDEITGLWDGQVALKAAADQAIARAASQRLRVSQLTVELVTATNNLFTALLALTPGERVRVTNLPSSHFGVTYMDGYAEGWTLAIGPSGFTVTLDLSPADAPSEGLWDDATYGRWGWGDGVCTLSSGIASGDTSLTLTWTGSAVLSTTAGDYPLDIDLNGERITLPSAPAGGTSPRTFTGVTRGVAPTVARAHSAGETVDIWNAARWAM